MATRPYILSPKLSDAATFTTATTTLAGSGIGNLQNSRPHSRCRFTTTNGHVVIDFGAAVSCDTLVLGWVKLDAGDATFRLRAATSEANLTAAPGYDSTTLTVWPSGSDLSAYLRPHRAFDFVSQSFRWWRVDIDDGASTYGHVELSRLMLGARIEPARVGVSDPIESQGQEPAAILTSRSGERVPQYRGFYNQLPVQWPAITEAEHERMWSAVQERGSHSDIALVLKSSTIYPMLYTRIGGIAAASVATTTLADESNERYRRVRLSIGEFAPVEMT